MYDGVQVGLGYPSLAQPVGLIKPPGFPRSKGRQLARSKRFPGAESSCDWVSLLDELSKRSRDAEDLVGSGLVPKHSIIKALRSVSCVTAWCGERVVVIT